MIATWVTNVLKGTNHLISQLTSELTFYLVNQAAVPVMWNQRICAQVFNLNLFTNLTVVVLRVRPSIVYQKAWLNSQDVI